MNIVFMLYVHEFDPSQTTNALFGIYKKLLFPAKAGGERKEFTGMAETRCG